MATSKNFPELLDPGLRQIFYEQTEKSALRAVGPLLFGVHTSEKAVEYDLTIGGLTDFDEFKGIINYEDPEELWKSSFEHKEYTKALKIERKLVDDEMYSVINRLPRQYAMVAMRTKDKHAASVFNNAFSSDFTGFDAVSLCNASHPLSPSKSGTQSNAGSTALSYDAVNATMTLMEAYTDDVGELISVMPDLLIVPRALASTANEICNTYRGSNSQQPGTANYAANYAQDQGMRYVVWNHLSDTNNWFLADSEMMKDYLLWFDRKPLELTMDPTSDYSLEGRWRAYMRYSYGWSGWKFVYGHEVA